MARWPEVVRLVWQEQVWLLEGLEAEVAAVAAARCLCAHAC